MIDLKEIDQVKSVQANLRTLPIGDSENMKFLDQICGWYDFSNIDPNLLLIQNGKRQILATIKTLLEQPAETIVALAHKG